LSAGDIALLAGATVIPSVSEAREFVEKEEPLSAASVNVYRQYIPEKDHTVLLRIARAEKTVEAFEAAAKQALATTEINSSATEELVTFAWNALVYAQTL